MGFFARVLGSLLGDSKQKTATRSPAPSSPDVPAPAVVRPKVAISWQEMLDPGGGIAAYCLRPAALRGGQSPSGAELLRALEQAGVRQLAERRRVLIPVRIAQWLRADFSPLIAANVHFLCLREPDLSVQDWLAWIDNVRRMGGLVAFDANGHDSLPEGHGIGGMILLDAEQMPVRQIEQWLTRTNPDEHSPVAVAGVATWSEQRYLTSLGVSFCQGPFAAMPDEAEQLETISQSRMVLIELLNLLRQEAEIGEIVAVARRDPAVVIKLIEMANSPLYGVGRQITGIEDAIMLLGRDALYRWIALALFRIDPQGQRDESLLVIALSRAAFLEKLAVAGNRRMAEELFLVGLFSVVDSLLRQPMGKVLGQVSLPPPVLAALLKQGGVYAQHMMLVQAMETCRIEAALAITGSLAIDPAEMLSAYADSMRWATLET